MYCSVVALIAVFCSGHLTWSADNFMFIRVTHCTTTSKKGASKIICKLCQQTSPKRWFANLNMMSPCDVTDSVYPVTTTTICHCLILEFGRGTYNQAVAPGITRPLHATEVWPWFGSSQRVVPQRHRVS